MPGTFAIELAETLDVIQRDRRLTQGLIVGVDRLYAREMQKRVEQHGGVAVGEDKAVAVGPDGVLRIEAQKMLPELVSHRRQRHGRTRMSGVGLLHRVHGQRADGVNGKLVKVSGVL